MGILVAGGTGGLGVGVVAELLGAGYEVTVADVAGRAPAGARMVTVDLIDPHATAEAVTTVGELEAIVNLVGGFEMGPKVGAADLASFERMWRLNLVPAFNLAHAGVPAMAASGGGAFVGVSARAALQPFSGAAGYVSAKAALLAFVKALDAEYAAAGVRANAILPSVIDTPANREAMPDADWSAWAAPAQIGRVIRFLVSGDAGVVGGAAVPV